ncbi:MAG: hypothetical protein COA86_18680 [Kangiella sp.]|nr:MAG: hypothetical protein COA86_18680 [Kangiella sp.]
MAFSPSSPNLFSLRKNHSSKPSIVHPNKAKMPAHIKTLLTSMNLQSDNWLTQIKNFNKGSPHSIGCLAKLQDKAEALKKKWIKGVSASRKYYLRA